MLAEIGGAVASIVTGGATGLIGAAISRYADYKIEGMRLLHELTVKKIDAETQVSTAQIGAEAQETTAAYQALGTSLEADKASYLPSADTPFGKIAMGMVDWVRGMTRPLITVYLIGITSWFSFTLYGMVMALGSGAVPATDLLSLWANVINMVLYLTASAVLWWFGGRSKAPDR